MDNRKTLFSQTNQANGNAPASVPTAKPLTRQGDHEQLLRRMRQGRYNDFANEAAKAKLSRQRASRVGGYYSVGRDEMGLRVETAGLKMLRVDLEGWRVRMSFRREDAEKNDGHWKDVEQILRTGRLKTSQVWADFHIISAVRACKHIRKNYEAELMNLDSILRPLEEANARLVELKGERTEARAHSVISLLESFRETLSRKEVAALNKIAGARLDKTIGSFQKIGLLPENKRAFQFGTACSDLTALRNTLGVWRQKQLAGLMDFNRWRENALRMKRDDWLLKQLVSFSEDLACVSRYIKDDAKKSEIIARAESDIRSRKKDVRAELLKFLKDGKTRQEFRVKVRTLDGIQEYEKKRRHGIHVNDGKKYDRLYYQYYEFYDCLKNGQTAQAKRELEFLDVFVKARKPRFILDELKKEPDPYLAPVIAAIEKAVDAFETAAASSANPRDFKNAQALFAEARDLLVSKTAVQQELPFPKTTL